jgi:hypothetical protein
MKWWILLLIAVFAFSCGGGDDDDNDSGVTVDDTSGDDTAADDTATTDDTEHWDDDVTDDDADDDLDDDVADDTQPDDDVVDDTADDTGDDDTTPPVEGCIEGDFIPYWGNLHAHTSYSDGEQTPADAFAWARDMAGLDIQLITDHLEQLYLPFPSDRWGKCTDQADAANDPGAFIADCGYEYGSGFLLPLFQSTGHNNVFNADYLFPMIQLDFHDFYQSLVDCPTCIGQFNHPIDDATMHWHHWEYFPDVDEKMNLFEFNTAASDDEIFAAYFEALAAGWTISPMYNQDNHGPDWGTKNDRRSGFFMENLTREDMYVAMQERRSFMSMDKNASITMMADDVCWMGSILSGYTSLPLTVEAIDEDVGDGFATIEIFGPGQTLMVNYDCAGSTDCIADIDVTITGPTYFVARATQTDGNYLISAPIWAQP